MKRFALAMSVLLLTACGTETTTQNTSEKPTEQITPTINAQTLGMTLDEFSANWLDKMKQAGLTEGGLPPINVQTDNTFSTEIGRGVVVAGTIDKTSNHLQELSYTITPQGNMSDIAEPLFFALGTTANALSPNKSPTETGEKLKELMNETMHQFIGNPKAEPVEKQITVESIIYTVQISEPPNGKASILVKFSPTK